MVGASASAFSAEFNARPLLDSSIFVMPSSAGGENDGLLLTDVEYATCKDLLEVRYTVENRNKGQTPVRNDLILAFQNGIGLRAVSPTTWTVMLEGAHARMTQSFRLRDRATRPVIQPDRTW